MDNSSDPIQYSGSNIGRNHLFKQKLFLILLLPPIIAAVGFVLYTSNKNIGFDNRSKASTVPVSMEFNPTSQNVNSGDTFTLGISLNTGDDTVTAVELHLSYDPELQVESLNRTDYLPITLQEASFSNGKASFVLGSDPSTPRKGSGIIATITFKALSAGTPSIRFDQETQVAALGKDSNALMQLPAAAQITISGSSTPIPSSTPTTDNPCDNPQTGTKSKGDANCDGRISGLDYVIWMTTQCNPEGTEYCSDFRADFDSNKKVNNGDYDIWFLNSRQ